MRLQRAEGNGGANDLLKLVDEVMLADLVIPLRNGQRAIGNWQTNWLYTHRTARLSNYMINNLENY